MKNGVASASSPPQVAACSAQPSAWRRAETSPRCHALAQRGLEARDRLGHACEALRRDLPVVLGVVGHEVEAAADLLHRAPDDPQRRAAPRRRRAARTASWSRSVITSAAMRSRSSVRGARSSAASVSRSSWSRALARVGREVGELVLVAGDAGVGRGDRIERGVREHVLIRDLVNL